METTDIYKYAYNLIKKKNYYIKELYNKLIIKYEREEVAKLIKHFIINEYINDKVLVKLKINYFIYEKKYGINYIYNYFIRYDISTNLIKFIINSYEPNIFEINKVNIINGLKEKGKDDNYINNYLIRKGYNKE